MLHGLAEGVLTREITSTLVRHADATGEGAEGAVWLGERLEDAEEEGNSIGRPEVSTNSDP